MTVFKAILLHFWRHKIALIAFTVIFFGMALAFSQSSSDNEFSITALDLQVVDHSDDEVSRGLIENLSQDNNVEVVDKTRSELQEEILLMSSDGVIIIEEGLEDRFVNGNGTVEVIVDERVAGAFQVETVVNKYFQYLAAGYQANGEIDVQAVNDTTMNTVDVQFLDVGETAQQANFEYMSNYMNFMGYVFLLLITIVGGNVMSDVNQPVINNRVKVSPIKQTSHSVQTVLGQLIITIFMAAIFVGFAFILRHDQLEGVPIANMVVAAVTLPLLALSFLHLLNSITNNKFIINSFANFVIIGMAFLSGIMLPIELFGDGMKQLATMMPLYHYTQIYSDMDKSLIDALPSISIVVLFSIALIVLGTIISKNRRMQV